MSEDKLSGIANVTVELQSTITCPECGHSEPETMPTEFCQFYYECKGCGALLRPNPGDCCVFCSFGTVPCPPIQIAHTKGNDAGCSNGS